MMKLRSHVLPVFGVAFVAAGALLHVAQLVHHKQEQMNELTRVQAAERDAIRVLKAEWAYLNSPLRLERLAHEYLALDVPEPSSVFVAPEALPHAAVRGGDLAGALYHEIGLRDGVDAQSGAGGADADAVSASASVPDAALSVERRVDAPAFIDLLQEGAP